MFLFFLCGLMVPFQMNIISLYKIVKSLGLMNSVFAVILVNTAINLPQSIFLSKEFVTSTVPMELEEAADIDGISVFGKFFQIVLPLMKPVMSTTIIIVTLNVWNEFMTPLLFIQSRENDVILQEVSRNIGQFATDWTAMFPMLMLGVGIDLSGGKSQMRYIVKHLAIRYSLAAVFAAVFYFLLPFELEVRRALVILAFAPFASATPVFTAELKEDSGLSATINSFSVVCSIVFIIALLLIML